MVCGLVVWWFAVAPLELIALLLAAVAPDGADVEHAVAELHEGAALDWDVEVGDVDEDEVDELLELGLAQVLAEAGGLEQRPLLECHQAVLGEEILVVLLG